MPALPPPLDKLANTPVLRSEMPAGFTHVSFLTLPADPRYHTLGMLRIDFKSALATESASYALFKSSAQAAAFVPVEAHVKTGGFFHVAVARAGRIVVGVAGSTRAQAQELLRLALAHLRRSTR